jgi:hypothetical protein
MEQRQRQHTRQQLVDSTAVAHARMKVWMHLGTIAAIQLGLPLPAAAAHLEPGMTYKGL